MVVEGKTRTPLVSQWLADRLSNNAPRNIKQVELYFPITGPSFLPPDRVFGLTEKVIRKREVVYKPSEYIETIKEHSHVLKDGVDCPIYDWKKEKGSVMKQPGKFHFQIGACRRIMIKRPN